MSCVPNKLFVMGAVMAGLVACGPNVKGQTQQWDNNKKSTAELSAKYPNFAGVLKSSHARATKQWEAALKLSDDDKKAEAMKEVNKSLLVLNKIQEIESKSESVKGVIKKIGNLRLPKTKRDYRQRVMREAQEEIDKVSTALNGATVANETEALAVLDPQVGELISARGAADRGYNSLKPKKAKKKKRKKR